jgi:hypothetical protein
MTNVIHFPTPAERLFKRGSAAMEMAKAVYEYERAAGIEQMTRLCTSDNDSRVSYYADQWLYDKWGVDLSGQGPGDPGECLSEPYWA